IACVNNSVVLNATGGETYAWLGPAGFSEDGHEIRFTPRDTSAAGVYTLTVRNMSNCAASATLFLSLLPQPFLSVQMANNKGCAPFCTKLKIPSPGNGQAWQGTHQTFVN